MQDSKSILLSVTFWGAIIAAISPMAKKYGYTFDATGMSNDIVGVLGALLAVFGRFRAGGVHVPCFGPSDPPNQKGFAKIRMLLATFACAVVVACASQGAPKSPLQGVLAAEDQLIAATQSLNDAKPLLTKQQFADAEAIRERAKSVLWDARKAAVQKDQTAYMTAITTFNSLLVELGNYYATKKGAK